MYLFEVWIVVVNINYLMFWLLINRGTWVLFEPDPVLRAA